VYVPKHFQEDRVEVLRGIMEANPLATVVAQTTNGLVANHCPLVFRSTAAAEGALIGHIARANPFWRETVVGDVLAIFSGPNSYISPSWYAAKQQTGKVVPTWNYAAVHLYGKARFIEDRAQLRQIVEDLTGMHEAKRSQPWSLQDAPADYIEQQLGAIIGIEISVTRIEGKLKFSQNRSSEDQLGVIEKLENEAAPDASALAQLMRESYERRPA